MSVNYAAGLSPYEHKGVCGLPELTDSADEFERKTSLLAEYIRANTHLVVHTGAGISTAAGIPDFRGPKGVWTLEKQGKEPVFDVSFNDAQPSFTHLALVALEKAGYLKFMITQNVDGLHLRSGLPMDRLAELHGDMFVERCDTCDSEQVHPTCVPTIGQKYTSNKCLAKKQNGRSCRGRMRDSVLDWEDDLPHRHFQLAQQHSRMCDVSLTLGTSLRIVPAADLPLMAKKRINGKFCVVNLQKTKHHAKASLVLHSRVDEVMRRVMALLQITVAPYEQPRLVMHSTNPVLPLSHETALSSKSIAKDRKRKLTKTEDDLKSETSKVNTYESKQDAKEESSSESIVNELLSDVLDSIVEGFSDMNKEC